jgi:hypothetical protein
VGEKLQAKEQSHRPVKWGKISCANQNVQNLFELSQAVGITAKWTGSNDMAAVWT